MLLKFTDSEEVCVSFSYKDIENIFEIQNAEGKTICEYRPLLKMKVESGLEDYQYFLLQNDRDDYSENSIFPVYVSQIRIGWIFPIQALLSDQHNYSDNSHFLIYAYVASCLLLNDIKSKDEIAVSSEQIELTDFYDDSLTILVLNKKRVKEIVDFNIRDYTVSLYQKGYSYSGRGNLDSEIERIDKRLNLIAISKELRNVKYIHTLFSKEIPKEQEPFAKFHTYYQIIEILIAIVFEDKFKKFVEQLNEETSSLFDKREELGNMVLEKQRVKWLFSNYVSISSEKEKILNGQCKKLLGLNGKKTSETMAENLYSVRCLLVHSMYILNDESDELLKELNKSFLDVVIEMLLFFSTKEA